ncbi:MAG: methionyl-tRNA formyltransferase [Candidatus Paceibacterota bacterium]
MNEKLKFIFFGTPQIASQTLDILTSCGYIPSIIVTSPDKPAGRGLHLTPSPVSIWAEKHNIPCLKPEKITPEFIEKLKSPPVGLVASHQSDWWLDLFVVVAYGKILPESLIKTPKLGTINIHYSLLPRWRGASPLEATLLNGDTVTGVSIQQMAFKLDSGPILAKEEIPIELNETKEELKNKLIKLGGDLLCKIIPEILENKITPEDQDETKVTYCIKIKKEDGQIDPSGDPILNWNKYRAFYGWPGIFFFKNEKRIKITKAKYENDSFIIERVIPEGKKEINYSELLKQN